MLLKNTIKKYGVLTKCTPVICGDVVIPDGVTSIGEWAFWECSSLTIHAAVGSYAEKYAKESHIPFVTE